MKNMLQIQPAHRMKTRALRRQQAGFSLVEMLVAMAIFLIIGGAAVNLVSKHAPLASSAQNQTGLNIALRNAISQMEIDVSNAGTGYYPGANIAAWPVGITVTNASQAAACNSGTTYTDTCFDSMTVIQMDPNTPPSHPVGATTDVSDTSATIFTTPSDATPVDQLAAHFHDGDWVLVLSADGQKMAAVQLTKDGDVSGTQVHLAHHPINKDGTSGDPFGISRQISAPDNKLGATFTSNDWVLRMNPITYYVDTSDPSNPKLMRSQGGVKDVIAEQVIGFRVGASVRVGTVDEPFSFNDSGTSWASGCTSNCGYQDDWAQIRAIRISIIGRTPPNNDVTNRFHNSFDGGAYKIQGASVTINPRNLSMGDQTN